MVQHDENREREVQLLVKEVLSGNVQFYDNPDGPYEWTCPYCSAKLDGGFETILKGVYMDDLQHDHECAYIIAKGLKSKMKTVMNYKKDLYNKLRSNIMTNCANAVDPDHYKKGTFQTIDVIEDFLESRYDSRLLTTNQKYLICNTIKYISRAGLKGSTPEDAIADLKKAENYLHRAITGEWIDAC